jgi:HlyD family secretion protein
MKTVLGMLLVGSIGAIVVANLNRDPSFASFRWKMDREAPLLVRAEAVERGTIIRSVEAPGRVDADVEVNVSAQVMARIVDLPVKEGDVVAKDDLLAKLDAVDFEAEVRTAEARVQRLKAAIELAKLDLGKSKRDFELNRRLLESKAVGQTEVADLETLALKAKTALAMSEAELIEAEGALIKAKENLSDTVIRSPVNGIVSKRMAKEGEVVVVGTMNNPGTVLLEVSDLDSRIVRAAVDEIDVPMVKPGQKAKIYLQDSKKKALTGVVDRITPQGDKSLRGFGNNQSDVASFETIIRIDEPTDDVRLGMTANVEIEVEQKSDVLKIPAQAVAQRRSKDLPKDIAATLAKSVAAGKDPAKQYFRVVFVDVEGEARIRPVVTGISDSLDVEILDGLKEGEKIIIGPYHVFDQIKDGRKIEDLAKAAP